MQLRELSVEPATFEAVSAFVETHHYSHSVKGLTPEFCFVVRYRDEIVGAAIFGKPAYEQQRRKYSEGGSLRLTELRRFVMIDDTPRNSESFVLGVMFRQLAKHGVQRILSYADPAHGHSGIVYRATGFHLVGETPRTQVIQFDGKRKVSTRCLRRCVPDSCELRPDAKQYRALLESGEATVGYEPGKIIYLKDLKVPA